MIPSWATGGVLTAPPTPLITTGYVAGNSLAAQNFNWILNHVTLEINNVLTAGGQAQNSAVDNQLLTAINGLIARATYIALSVGSPYALANGSYGTVDVTTGATGYQVVLPSAQSALAIGFEVDLRKADSGAGSVLVTVAAGDYLAGFLNGQWQVTEQYGHVKLRPVRVGGAYGWAVQSCDGTVYRSVITSTQSQASPTVNQWYNRGGTLALKPGVYELSWQATPVVAVAGAIVAATLSTGSSSESDIDFTGCVYTNYSIASASLSRSKRVVIAVNTTYYLNVESEAAGATSVNFNAGSGLGNTRIEAKRVG